MVQRIARGTIVGVAVSLMTIAAVVAMAQTPAPPPPAPPPATGDAPAQAHPASEASAIVGPPPPVEDPTTTAGGALTLFMASRHYATIRQLKSVMTPALQARYDRYSATFNGKRGIRIALFEIGEKQMQRLGARSKEAVATVKTLWEEQGEAMELRVESVRLARQADGLWRVSGLDKVSSESLRFPDAVPGVTTLRILLRAWHRHSLASARGQMSASFLKRYDKGDGGEKALKALFEGDASSPPSVDGAKPRRAAYQILSCEAQGDSQALAKVRLCEGYLDRPTPIDGPEVRIVLVKKGPYWQLDSWD